MNWRLAVLLGAVLLAMVVVFLFPAIPQNEAYHNFADTRAFFGVPSFLNVVSNAFFLLVGVLGIRCVWRPGAGCAQFVDPGERWPYFAFFLAVALTAFGSSWYHLRPNDATLVWDRIPMACGFMALVAAVVAERIDVKTGVRLLFPLIAAGVGSVIYWEVTQSRGDGDLRPYALAQFGGLLVLVLVIALFPPRYTRGPDFVISLGLYGVAKLFEAIDRPVFSLGGAVSGHTLKHIAAAISTYWILRMLKLRRPIASALRVL